MAKNFETGKMEAVAFVHRSLASSQFTFRLYEKEEGEGIYGTEGMAETFRFGTRCRAAEETERRG